jgi:uncharacterized membrane protein YgdD (TMEM256/DUF423 family)
MPDASDPRFANRFDIRRVITGVFTLYGVILVALGLFGTHEIKNKAAGINIDAWTGLGMLVVAALMLTWALLRPLVPRASRVRGETAPARATVRPADA